MSNKDTTLIHLPESSGIYRILNRVTGWSYVGSSANIRHRVANHFRDLRAGRHFNQKLQRDFAKIGPDGFDVEVVRLCIPASLLVYEHKAIRRLGAEYCTTLPGGSRKPNFQISVKVSRSMMTRLKRVLRTRDQRATIAAVVREMVTRGMRAYRQGVGNPKHLNSTAAQPEPATSAA